MVCPLALDVLNHWDWGYAQGRLLVDGRWDEALARHAWQIGIGGEGGGLHGGLKSKMYPGH
jgi:hypothetical protein